MFERRPNRVYLSLGSNIDSEQNIPAAARELRHFGRPLAHSQVWESPPFGTAETSRSKGNFLNAAILLETELTALEICIQAIPAIEGRLGRTRDPRDKNAPRTIDVDLSLFNREVLSVAGHRIPDPDILVRAHVAVPLSEVDPGYIHPLAHKTLAEIAARLAAAWPLQLRTDVTLDATGR